MNVLRVLEMSSRALKVLWCGEHGIADPWRKIKEQSGVENPGNWIIWTQEIPNWMDDVSEGMKRSNERTGKQHQ